MARAASAPSGEGERGVWRGLLANRGGRLGLVLIAGLFVTALAADFLASERPIALRFHGVLYLFPNLVDPIVLRAHTNHSLSEALETSDWLIPPVVSWGINEQDKDETPLSPPSARHWLGTDTSRRDVAARLVHGSRVAILVGLVSVAIYVLIGTLLGLLAAYFGGWVDALISRLVETVMSIPVFVLILAVMGVVERSGVGTMTVIIGLVYWTRVTRLVRAEALRVKGMEFIEAAVALGYSTPRIIFRHILPSTLGPVLVTATFGVATAVLVEASLSFLGFGTPDTVASWGGLLRGALGNCQAWWLVAFPGAAVFLNVLAYNLVGEALRDTLDPRLRYETEALPRDNSLFAETLPGSLKHRDPAE